MPVSFESLVVGGVYTRPQLAERWGYRSYEAISRGAVTPAGTPFIILFITREKQAFLPQYRDELRGERLAIEGERSHASDERIVHADERGDEVHVFYRERHHAPFAYMGRAYLLVHDLRRDGPSRFEFVLGRDAAIAAHALETELLTHGAEISAFVPDEEGRRRIRQHVEYERSARNRRRALELHGTTCMACGFDFNRAYGAGHAESYIEVHHIRSITAGVTAPNPEHDLVPLCSNCHSMAHRRRGVVLNLEELRSLLKRARRAER